MKTVLYDKNGNVILGLESFNSTNDLSIESKINSIEKHYGIRIPSQFRQALLNYNDELIHVYGHDINCIPLNGDASKWWMFDEAGNKKYFSGIKDVAYKVFIVVESMGNGDSLLVYKNNELYFYSHDTNIPLTKVTIYKDFNDYLNKVLKPYFGKKDSLDTNLYDKNARVVDDVCKKYMIEDKRGVESLDLTKVKYETGHDAYGANVSKETINFLSKNKDKLKKMFLEAALSYYKNSDYGNFAEEEIGKKIKDCTTADMDSLIHGPYKILEDSSIRSYRKSDFVITAENKLDPEHGIAVGFSKSPLKVVETGDIGYFL